MRAAFVLTTGVHDDAEIGGLSVKVRRSASVVAFAAAATQSTRAGPGRAGAAPSALCRGRPVLYTYTPSDRDRPAVHSADRLLPLDLMTAFHGFRHDALSR